MVVSMVTPESATSSPTFRGSFHRRRTWSLVSPVCHSEFLRCSPGPDLDFTACWMPGSATALKGVACHYPSLHPSIHPSIPPSLSRALTDLIWVGGVGAAVTGVSHSISVPVHLVSVLDKLAIV
ncbi:hypothetical protein EYF80_046507 [Liparis tanakae]|uniref:Uncharacterized protein n=1 Tax=Liparis tanakae TaxID=230148 RepID=A0A4Z2FPY2_9TELE|nr:hypothetical protein EYF80_046507 [Liparis tanakae]